MLVVDHTKEVENVPIERLMGKFLLLDVETYFAHLAYTKDSGEIFYTALFRGEE